MHPPHTELGSSWASVPTRCTSVLAPPPPHISEEEKGRRCRADDNGSLPIFSRCCAADKVGRQRSSSLDASATEPSAPAPIREERPSPAASSAPPDNALLPSRRHPVHRHNDRIPCLVEVCLTWLKAADANITSGSFAQNAAVHGFRRSPERRTPWLHPATLGKKAQIQRILK